MAKDFAERFGEWQNYVHYILLAIGIYIWHSIPYNEVVEQMYVANPVTGIFALILWWTVGLFILDTIIHGIFWVLPKPYQWRD